jgi:hypothetical protein
MREGARTDDEACGGFGSLSGRAGDSTVLVRASVRLAATVGVGRALGWSLRLSVGSVECTLYHVMWCLGESLWSRKRNVQWCLVEEFSYLQV